MTNPKWPTDDEVRMQQAQSARSETEPIKAQHEFSTGTLFLHHGKVDRAEAAEKRSQQCLVEMADVIVKNEALERELAAARSETPPDVVGYIRKLQADIADLKRALDAALSDAAALRSLAPPSAIAPSDSVCVPREWQDVVEQFGRRVTDMFEQLEKGNWRDEHDHDVRMCAAMIALKEPVMEAIRLRAMLSAAPTVPAQEPVAWRRSLVKGGTVYSFSVAPAEGYEPLYAAPLAPRMEQGPTRCSVSFPHPQHDFCDGNPDAPAFGAALAPRMEAVPSGWVHFSTANHPDCWDTQDYGVIEFKDAEEAKKAERLFNKISGHDKNSRPQEE